MTASKDWTRRDGETDYAAASPALLTEPMSLAVALDFADHPRPKHTLQAPADTNGELYRALAVLAAEVRALEQRVEAAEAQAVRRCREWLREYAHNYVEKWTGITPDAEDDHKATAWSIMVAGARMEDALALPKEPDLRNANPIGLTPRQKEVQREQLLEPLPKEPR